jgi:uncharacterized membrane protein YhaH (DUF805 family)
MSIFSYKGRIGRQKYLLGLILVAVVSTIVEFLYFFIILTSVSLLLSKAGFFAVILVFLLGIIISFIPIFLISPLIVKRFHDVDKSGKWWFALLIPIYNIHLAIGLLTERGTLGSNQYGEDSLLPNTPDDVFNRFSQNKIVRMIVEVIIIGLFLLSMMLSVISKVKEQVAQRQIMNNAIQNAVDEASGKTSSPDTGRSLSFSTVPVAQKLSINTKDWKSTEINKKFNSGDGIASICYTIKYPSNLYNPYESYNSFTNRAQTQFLHSAETSTAIFIDSQIGGYINDFLIKDSQWLAYDTLGRLPQNYKTKDFKTSYGLDATEIVGDDGFWFIYLSISEKVGGNIVLGIHPPTPMDNSIETNFPDISFGEAMVNTIQASSCTQ